MLGLDSRRIRLNRDKQWEAELINTKTGEDRTIDLTDRAVTLIGEMKPSGRVFDMTVDHFHWYFRKAARDAGLGRVRPHDLRHTAATRYMEATGDLFGLMQHFGWKDVATAKRYQHKSRRRGQAIKSVHFPPIPHKRTGIDMKVVEA